MSAINAKTAQAVSKNTNSDNIAFYVRREAGISPNPKDSLEETILALIEQSHHKHREGVEKFFQLHNFKVSVNKGGKTKFFDGDIQFYFEGEKAIHVRAFPTFNARDSLRTTTWHNSREQIKTDSLLKTIDLGYVVEENTSPESGVRSFRFLSFLGRGATVGDMVKDMALEAKNKVSPATVGQRLSYLDPNISRETLETIAQKGRDLDLWKNAFPPPSYDQIKVAKHNPSGRETKILDFLDKYGRPPFVSPQSLVEVETGRPVTINLFGKELVASRRENIDGKKISVTSFSLRRPNDRTFWLSIEPFYDSVLNEQRLRTEKLEVVFPQEQNGLYKIDFCRKNSFADFLQRITVSSRYVMVDNDLFMAEAVITKGKRKLTAPELDAIGRIFDKRYVFSIRVQEILDKSGEKHEIVVANMSESNPVYKKLVCGDFVLSDNGQVLVGRALLGGVEPLKLSRIKKMLGSPQRTRETER